MKPIFCVYVLKHTLPKLEKGFSWHKMDDMFKLWLQTRQQLRNKNFIKDLCSFDIRRVTKEDIALVHKIMDDNFMQDEMTTRHLGIAAESNFCLQMWRWCRKIIDFSTITQKLSKIGISKIEDRMERALKTQQVIRKILATT